MTPEFLLRRLRLIGAGGDSTFDFKKYITVITGPVASGKTSMLEMIKHGLGGDAVITAAVRRDVRAVELLVRIGEERFLLERPIGRGSDVAAVTLANPAGEPIGERQLVPVSSRVGEATLSQFLMGRLEIPQLRFPRSARDPDEDLTAVTFNDVYGLMYLDQDQIDSAIGHEGARHQKWRQTFEVVYGLADARLAALRTALGAVNADLSRAASYVREVERFFQAVGAEDSDGAATGRREGVVSNIETIDEQLSRLNERIRLVQAAPASRDDVAGAERRMEEVRMELARHLAERESLRRVRAQVRADLEQVERALSSTTVLREFEFQTCPRCLQDLPHRPDGACGLCDQPDPPATANLSAETEQRRLQRQLDETVALIATNDGESDRRAAELAAAEQRLAVARAAWDRESREALSPYLAQIAELSERRGAVVAELASYDRAAGQRQELAAARAEIVRLQSEQRRLTSEIHAAQGELSRGRETLSALSEAYAEIISSVNMPWVESATIDPKTYVPLVNGNPVRSLSSGGLKTIANFAYYLAQLQTRQRGYPVFLPSFMVIDSPRKNFGSNAEDAESMRRFYRALWALSVQRTGSQFQVIVADNDSPSGDRDRFELLPLDRDHPLVDVTRLRGDR